MRLPPLRAAAKRAGEHNVTALAAALAYSAALAIPATALLVVGLFGLTADPETVHDLIDRLGGVAPESVLLVLEESLVRVTQSGGGSLTAVIVGGLLAMWTVSGAMQQLQWALNISYELQETRSAARRRLVALSMFGLVALALVLTMSLLVLGPLLSAELGEALDAERAVSWVWWTLQWPLQIAGLLFAFAALLTVGPDHGHRPWRMRTPGATLGVLIWLAASGGFALYTSTLGSYNKIWGSLAAPIVLLTWLWLSALALLIGAEVDRAVETANRPSPQPEAAEGDIVPPAARPR